MIRCLALVALVLASFVSDASAAFVGTNRSNLGVATAPQPAVSFNFVEGGYFQAPSTTTGTVANVITTTRASAENCSSVAGIWITVTNNVICVTNQGALFEPARNNSIRNNSMQGAVAGTPGTLPTNWSIAGAAGLTTSVVGTGTDSGVVEYIDIRLNGTSSGLFTDIYFDTSTGITFSPSVTLSLSEFLKVAAGATTGMSVSTCIRELTSAGAFLSQQCGSELVSSLTSTLQRVATTTKTLTGASGATARVQPALSFNYANGAVIDITIRIGWPQLENSFIANTVAAAAVAAGGVAYVNGDTITLTGGTGTQAVLTVTNAVAGIIQAGGVSITSAGSYTVGPTNPVAQGSTSGIGTGATFNITWTDKSDQGYATSPIRTTTVTGARAADVDTQTTFVAPVGPSYLLFGEGFTDSPVTNISARIFVQLDDGTANNNVQIYRSATTGVASPRFFSGGAVQYAPAQAVFPTGIVGRELMRVQQSFSLGLNSFSEVTSNVVQETSGVRVLPVGLTTMHFGANPAGGNLSGYLRRALLFNAPITTKQLRRLIWQ